MISNFFLRRGDSYQWSLSFDDGGDPAQPIDISGKTLTFTVKTDYNKSDNTALLQVSTTFPDDENSAAGIGSIFIPHSATANLIPDAKVYYDFQLAYYATNDQLIVTTLDAGYFKVAWDVTLSVPSP